VKIEEEGSDPSVEPELQETAEAIREQSVGSADESERESSLETAETELKVAAAYCPKCFKKLRLDKGDLGRRIQCAACWNIFTVRESMLCAPGSQEQIADTLELAIEILKQTVDVFSECAEKQEFQPQGSRVSAAYCPKCFGKLHLDESDLGRKMQCGACWYTFTVHESIWSTLEPQEMAIETLEQTVKR